MSFIRILVGALLALLQCSVPLAAQDSDAWDHFVFAQQWPMTTCIESQSSHEHTCHIPKNVTTWTVHGVWPSYEATMGPSFCNVSSPRLDFDPASLSPILGPLVKFWTNLYADTELFSFWKHEWCKHGTCAITLDAINSEVKYFQKGMDLQKKFDLLSILGEAGITPSDDTTYEYTEFNSALTRGLGTQPKLSCAYDKATKTQYIAQIEFCISKDFNIMDCPTKHNGPLRFLPASTTLQSPGRLDYAIRMKQRQPGSPESCVPTQRSMNKHHPIRESPCRDTETVALPVIKYF